MNSRDLARYLVLGGVLAGLTAGSQLRANTTSNPLAGADKVTVGDSTKKNSCSGPNGCNGKATSDKAAENEKHACAGLNGCKGKGNCKSGDAGCSGKNSCKGKGGCASKEYHHGCAGQNACKGQGPGGKNECKGKGSCSVPPAPAKPNA